MEIFSSIVLHLLGTYLNIYKVFKFDEFYSSIVSVHRKSIFSQTEWKERECKIIHDPEANSKFIKSNICVHTDSYTYSNVVSIEYLICFTLSTSIHVAGLKNKKRRKEKAIFQN